MEQKPIEKKNLLVKKKMAKQRPMEKKALV